MSYNSADTSTAARVAERLLSDGVNVWWDKWEILAGDSITSKVEEAIMAASAFIILLSRNSVDAPWVREELRIAIQRRIRGRDFRVIPLRADDCTVPAFLADYRYIDLRKSEDDWFYELWHAVQGRRPHP